METGHKHPCQLCRDGGRKWPGRGWRHKAPHLLPLGVFAPIFDPHRTYLPLIIAVDFLRLILLHQHGGASVLRIAGAAMCVENASRFGRLHQIAPHS